MKVVIQCAAGKQSSAGVLRTRDGIPVHFRAHPELAPERDDIVFAHPDGQSDRGGTWRDLLAEYNERPDGNPLGLTRAADLYAHPAYRELDACERVSELLILSAGWGLISADCLTPDYDITFSSSADQEKRRGRRDIFHDWSHLDLGASEPLVFLGGKAYFGLFASLSEGYRGPRIAFHNSADPPIARGVEVRRFETAARTNWHYGAAKALIQGTLRL